MHSDRIWTYWKLWIDIASTLDRLHASTSCSRACATFLSYIFPYIYFRWLIISRRCGCVTLSYCYIKVIQQVNMLGLNVLACTRLLFFVTYTVTLPSQAAISTWVHLPNLNLLLLGLRRLNLIHHVHVLVWNWHLLAAILCVVRSTLPLFSRLIQSVGPCWLSKPCSSDLRKHSTALRIVALLVLNWRKIVKRIQKHLVSLEYLLSGAKVGLLNMLACSLLTDHLLSTYNSFIVIIHGIVVLLFFSLRVEWLLRVGVVRTTCQYSSHRLLRLLWNRWFRSCGIHLGRCLRDSCRSCVLCQGHLLCDITVCGYVLLLPA